jgi:hypothetical protein
MQKQWVRDHEDMYINIMIQNEKLRMTMDASNYDPHMLPRRVLA